jgi:hypothetical protein
MRRRWMTHFGPGRGDSAAKAGGPIAHTDHPAAADQDPLKAAGDHPGNRGSIALDREVDAGVADDGLNTLLAGGDRPLDDPAMAEGVPERADPVAVDLVGNGRHRGGAGLHRPGVHGVGVVGEVGDRHLDRLVGRRRHQVVLGDRLAQRYRGVTDEHLGMGDRPVR